MPKGEFDTPGPFWRMDHWLHNDLRGGAFASFHSRMDEAERDELVGLLNKGTHFEDLLMALELALRNLTPGGERELGPTIRAAIAVAKGRPA